MVEEKNSENKSALSALSIGILIVFLLIVGGLYWWVSKKGKGQVVFPAGLNYTGEEPTSAPQPQRPTYDYTKLAGASDWVDFVSPKEQYTFKYPPSMIPLIFPGDANDSVTFDIADVPAQFNLMVLVETISNYDAKYKVNQDDAVGTDNYFFVIPGQTDKIIHVNNIFPTEGQAVFTRLLNSLDYKK